MKSEEKPAPDVSGKAGASMVVQMIATMADTTWRMFVPILGLLVVGVYADKTRGSFPWFTLLGFVLGTAASVLLIRNQFKKGTK